MRGMSRVPPRWLTLISLAAALAAHAAGSTASFAQRAQVARSEPQASEDHRVGERSPSGDPK